MNKISPPSEATTTVRIGHRVAPQKFTQLEYVHRETAEERINSHIEDMNNQGWKLIMFQKVYPTKHTEAYLFNYDFIWELV